jgi:hypothetical protein
MYLGAQRGPRLDRQAENAGIRVGAQRVDVVDHQPVQVRVLVQEPGEDAVAEEGGDLVEMARRVEPLDRDVVDVVGPSPVAGQARIARRPASRTFCLLSSRTSWDPSSQRNVRSRAIGTSRWPIDWPRERITGPSWP